MKLILATAACALACSALAGTNDVPVLEEPVDSALQANAGADVRIREEIMHNVPGLPGAPGAMMPRAYKKNLNHLRVRPRVWGQLDYEEFTLYGRLVNEFREHFIENGVKRKRRAYNFPDEVALDSLWIQGMGLFDGFFDFRIGRQDLFERGHSVFGLDRMIFDGAPYVGSRSCYADMIKLTFHTTDTSKLDAFAIYDNGRNIYRYGNRNSRGRPMNAIHPGDSPEMDEWGGGLVWHDSFLEKRIPYKLYVIHKHNEDYTAFNGRHVRDKQLTTFGVLLKPELTENVSFEFEGAHQFGTADSGRKQAGGTMGYTAVDFHKDRASAGYKPYSRLSAYYLSGDKHRTDADDNDTAWDPLWGRWPQGRTTACWRTRVRSSPPCRITSAMRTDPATACSRESSPCCATTSRSCSPRRTRTAPTGSRSSATSWRKCSTRATTTTPRARRTSSAGKSPSSSNTAKVSKQVRPVLTLLLCQRPPMMSEPKVETGVVSR